MMTHQNLMKKASLALAALLVVALPAAATLPLSLGHEASTPVGNVYASTEAPTCIDAAVPPLPPAPALPLPSLPVPLPVPTPALPDADASGQVCAEMGPEGAYVTAQADAAGIQADAEADADVPPEAGQASEQVQAFLQAFMDQVYGWF